MKCWIAIALLGAPLPLAAQAVVSHAYRVLPTVSLRIWVPAGSIRVETWERDSIRVQGTTAKGTHFFGASGGGGAKFGVENDDPAIESPAHGDLVVTVPRAAHVWIKMTDGQVVAAGTAGQLDVITVTGSIAIQDAQGVVSVETIDANTTLTRATGDIRARSGGGRITLADIHGTLTAATVNGAIELTGSALEDSRLETIGGPIAVRATVAPEALLDLETHSGAITLSLDRKALPVLDLSSRAGIVKNPLGAGSNSGGRIVARSFKGSINVIAATGIEGRKPTAPP
ncbi:MAG: hypothetical protein ACREK8_10440 [Gemmatimonadales bacterium]